MNQNCIQIVPRAVGSNLRILSWNILSEELTPGVPAIGERIDTVCGLLREYRPEAAGIQEISEDGYRLFEEKISDTYTFVNPKTPAGNYSFTGIAYDHTVCRLLDSGIEVFPCGNIRIRIMNWVHLERIDDGVRFVLLSTHWDRHACNRPEQAALMAVRVKELERRFADSPVISCGDFNARENSMAFHIFLQASGYREAKYLAAEPINNLFSGHNICDPNPQEDGNLSIDHIIVPDGTEVEHYEMLMRDDVICASDHYPVYADLKMKWATQSE